MQTMKTMSKEYFVCTANFIHASLVREVDTKHESIRISKLWLYRYRWRALLYCCLTKGHCSTARKKFATSESKTSAVHLRNVCSTLWNSKRPSWNTVVKLKRTQISSECFYTFRLPHGNDYYYLSLLSFRFSDRFQLKRIGIGEQRRIMAEITSWLKIESDRRWFRVSNCDQFFLKVF